jgi:hypothetical protein
MLASPGAQAYRPDSQSSTARAMNRPRIIQTSVMQLDASRAFCGANARTIGHEARTGGVQARRAGISVAVDDLLHPKSPSGAASGRTRRPSTIGGDADPLGLGVRGICAWAAEMQALRALANRRAARSRASAMEQTDQPVEATETRGAVVKMETGDCMGGLGLRASPQRWAKKLMTVASQLLLLFLSATPVACEAQVYSVDIYDSARTCESAYFIGSPPVHCGYVKYREYRDSEDRRLTPDLQHLAVRRPVFIKLQFSQGSG